MSLFSEFKAFINRGNVADMAVGIIIGAAFGKVISSLVNDVIMPPIGFVLGGVDFAHMKIVLGNSPHDGTPVAIKYGLFINTIIDFLIVAIVIFFVVKAMNRLKQPDAASTRSCPECLSVIPLNAKRCPQCTSALR